MKQVTMIVLMLLLGVGLVYSQSNPGETIIKGRIVGQIPEIIKFSVPTNGVCYEFFNEAIKPDSLGNFELRFHMDHPAIVILVRPGYKNLLIEPGKTYQLMIDLTSGQPLIDIQCDTEKIQSLFMALANPNDPMIEAMKMSNLPISIAKQKVDSMQNNEMAAFRKLLAEQEISMELFNLIHLDRLLYHSTILGNVAQIKFFNIRTKDPKAPIDSITDVWKEVILNIPLTTENLLSSKSAFYFIRSYLMFCEFTDENFTWEIHAEMRKKGLFHTYKMEIAKKHLSGNNLEFYEAAYIHSSAFHKRYEKELITLFEKFNTQFPNNKYSRYTEPLITDIIDFHNKANQEFGEETRFVTHYESIRSLNECLQNFKGKKVYIDIWGTWCSPCKEEFKHNTELKNLLKLKNIELLSISLDKDEADKQWKDMIKYYNLAGYHIRASKELYADLDKTLDLSFVPRYILVDENGKIIEKYASFPSQIKELEKQLSKD